MANVLIADIHEESCYFMRALVRGRKHRAVIATSRGKATALLETGLFDTLLIDQTTPEPERDAIVEAAETLLPGMPVIAITGEAGAKVLDASHYVAVVRRPISSVQLKHALQKAMAQVKNHWCNRRGGRRARVAVPIAIRVGETTVACESANLSTDGAAVRATDAQAFASIAGELAPGTTVPVALTLGELRIEAGARVVAVHRASANAGPDSGAPKAAPEAVASAATLQLSFSTLDEPDERRIQRFLKKAA